MKRDRVLIVDDHEEIRDTIEIYLRSENIEVFKVENGLEAIEFIKNKSIDLILMDIMMPKIDGIKATLEIRNKNNIPIIMLSAKAEERDKILGLNIGADDYITKPFNPLELIARVKAQIRRYKNLGAIKNKDEEIDVRGLTLNRVTKIVKVREKTVKLTATEFKILELLMSNLGRVFSAEEIYERIWNEKAIRNDSIMVHIKKIREKIEINPKEPMYLKVVWGIGYKIEP
ncbi:response regulator transcription factor [Clostridium sp.]|uniref:response regulator transcription factor n=1 Tax=Clostridium sp. TaxID=1506 RepID=UPI00399384E2